MIKETEIEELVFNQRLLNDFIKNNFQAFTTTKRSLFETGHQLELYHFNRILKPAAGPFILTHCPVNNLYAYFKTDDQFCLYLFVNISAPDQLNNFFKQLGLPWNVTKQDLSTGDFDMLLWRKDELEISLLAGLSTNRLMYITNIPAKELVNLATLQ